MEIKKRRKKGIKKTKREGVTKMTVTQAAEKLNCSKNNIRNLMFSKKFKYIEKFDEAKQKLLLIDDESFEEFRKTYKKKGK